MRLETEQKKKVCYARMTMSDKGCRKTTVDQKLLILSRKTVRGVLCSTHSWQFSYATLSGTKVERLQNPYTVDGLLGTINACLKTTLH